MKSFVVYNDQGEILRTGACQDDDLSVQAGEGESVLEGEADDLTQMVVDGSVVDKPELSDAEKKAETIAELRKLRDNLLNLSDWTQVTDSPLADSKKAEWATYRQTLRDLPSNHVNTTSIEDVSFPDAPT
ncbi:MAG: phage tail assembly chaperone [SAR324 cluster bacterium]|nr:phage tail assembly chaperone [SAR324 cluster bacterium]